MRNKIIAVCDRDERYLQGMQDYFSRKGIADFEIMVFDDLEQARQENAAGFDILLIGETIYSDSADEITADKKYLLWENGQCSDNRYPTIAKFQSMEQIFSKVLEEYAEDERCSGRMTRACDGTKLVCFYSPDRADAQTVAALAAGEALAARGSKVLYLNLRAFAGLEELFGEHCDTDVTDYFYFMLRYADKARYKLESMKRSIGGLDYLPPALDYADLVGISAEQWEQAIDLLTNGTDYEYLLIDLSELCQGFYSLLARSEQIIFVQGSSAQADGMRQQYERLLTARGGQGILNKTHHFRMSDGWEREYTRYAQLGSTRLGEELLGLMGDSRNGNRTGGRL